MSTELQKKAAKLLNEYRLIEIATGESVSLASILKKAGFKDSSAIQASRIINKQGFREALAEEQKRTAHLEKSFEQRLVKLYDSILKSLESKGQMTDASYRDAKDLLSVISTNLRLIKGESTENIAVVQEIKTPEQAKAYLKEVGVLLG